MLTPLASRYGTYIALSSPLEPALLRKRYGLVLS